MKFLNDSSGGKQSYPFFIQGGNHYSYIRSTVSGSDLYRSDLNQFSSRSGGTITSVYNLAKFEICNVAGGGILASIILPYTTGLVAVEVIADGVLYETTVKGIGHCAITFNWADDSPYIRLQPVWETRIIYPNCGIPFNTTLVINIEPLEAIGSSSNFGHYAFAHYALSGLPIGGTDMGSL
jgi:hypothetical protein